MRRGRHGVRTIAATKTVCSELREEGSDAIEWRNEFEAHKIKRRGRAGMGKVRIWGENGWAGPKVPCTKNQADLRIARAAAVHLNRQLQRACVKLGRCNGNYDHNTDGATQTFARAAAAVKTDRGRFEPFSSFRYSLRHLISDAEQHGNDCVRAATSLCANIYNRHYLTEICKPNTALYNVQDTRSMVCYPESSYVLRRRSSIVPEVVYYRLK